MIEMNMTLLRTLSLALASATAVLAGCAAPGASPQAATSPYVEGFVWLHVFELVTADENHVADGLNAAVERWRKAPDEKGAAVTADRRAAVAKRKLDNGEYQVKVWRTVLGDEVTGTLPGVPWTSRSSERFLVSEASDSKEYIARLDTWQSIAIPDEIRYLHASSDGRWIGFWDATPEGGYRGIVGGRIVEDRLVEELRLQTPEGAPGFMSNEHTQLYWLPGQNAVVLSSKVLVGFDAQDACLLDGIGRIIGVVESEGVIVHVDESGRRLFGSRVQEDGSLTTEPLDHDRIRSGHRVWLLSPSGHYAVARSGAVLPSDRLSRIRQFPAWGGEFPRRHRLITNWLVLRSPTPRAESSAP